MVVTHHQPAVHVVTRSNRHSSNDSNNANKCATTPHNGCGANDPTALAPIALAPVSPRIDRRNDDHDDNDRKAKAPTTTTTLATTATITTTITRHDHHRGVLAPDAANELAASGHIKPADAKTEFDENQ